jgi:thymidylate kinase
VLFRSLKQERVQFKKILYPMLDLGESGKKLKRILWRKDRMMPEEEMQKLFTENRMEFEPTLKSWLDAGITVLAEDYVGTGIIWGLARGMELARIKEINKEWTRPEVSIVLDGPRRLDLRPGEGHIYQNDETEWYKVRDVYMDIADKFGWVIVDADAPILTVAARIWAVVKIAVNARK